VRLLQLGLDLADPGGVTAAPGARFANAGTKP